MGRPQATMAAGERSGSPTRPAAPTPTERWPRGAEHGPSRVRAELTPAASTEKAMRSEPIARRFRPSAPFGPEAAGRWTYVPQGRESVPKPLT